ncbi:uncharacterized protein ASPGLDRAFT_36640 [Aspergillus glaucus CBS 516.65]|uniref:Uncharacterized protein n=1 Tax=Aspergillus glaucus CBS 516.65 TaxID=1160497 RepID=A0A1L9VGW8_ASPGL|nr:hypothetical protein ASPGLDRAFT_36640 [Aspergillus glaucus CBS 516.65]OJJ83188.1 hypothetical protein ASPGLDRAFT_36640 [Aspergillus glaucus CBS 516.65]
MPHAREVSIHMLTTDTLKHHHNTEHQIPLGLRLRIRRDGAHGVDNLRIMGSRGALLHLDRIAILLPQLVRGISKYPTADPRANHHIMVGILDTAVVIRIRAVTFLDLLVGLLPVVGSNLTTSSGLQRIPEVGTVLIVRTRRRVNRHKVLHHPRQMIETLPVSKRVAILSDQ